MYTRQGREGASACSDGWVARAGMSFPWFKAPACGEKLPKLGEARLDVGLLDRTSLPLVMPALLIGKGRENHCVQLPREEVHPRAMTGENTISVGKSPCLR